MDSGQNHLLISRLSQLCGFMDHILDFSGAHPPPGVGDDAVAAELVAAVLNL